MGTSEWSKSEKEAARQVFAMAYDRECKSIEEKLRKRVTDLQNPEELWAIHDYLTEKRRKSTKNTTTDTRSCLLCLPGFYMKDGSSERI